MKGKCGHKKSIIYSDNPKMDTSGMSNEMTIEMMESGGPIEVKDMGAVVKYGSGGKRTRRSRRGSRRGKR